MHRFRRWENGESETSLKKRVETGPRGFPEMMTV